VPLATEATELPRAKLEGEHAPPRAPLPGLRVLTELEQFELRCGGCGRRHLDIGPGGAMEVESLEIADP